MSWSVTTGFTLSAETAGTHYRSKFPPPPVSRQLVSFIFGAWVSSGILNSMEDSQCGFKVFSEELTELLLPLLHVDRFAFDVEICRVLVENRVTMKRVPVMLKDSSRSAVSIVRDSLRSLFDLVQILRRSRQGLYHSPAIIALDSKRYWIARTGPKRALRR